TSSDREAVDEDGWAFRRGGTAVGRAVHGVLETIDLRGSAPIDEDAVATLASRFAVAENIPDAADTVAELAQSALGSKALREARASGRLWREVPVVAPVGDRLVEGYVDLLYETADGDLVVVDWKTDRARSESEIDAALGRYRLQGAGYALAVATVTGRPVNCCRFVFCRPGRAVERDIVDLEAAVGEARSLLGDTGGGLGPSP
ncbi:MAG: PD-(D/E)XK nuclease family protein, partial [Acidimicrobiales bacterium]